MTTRTTIRKADLKRLHGLLASLEAEEARLLAQFGPADNYPRGSLRTTRIAQAAALRTVLARLGAA